MYYYYSISVLGVKDIWWKKYLTIIQIIQFIIDVSVCSYCTYAVYYHPLGCQSHPGGPESGVAILSSYLFLFMGFYSKTYKTKKID